MLYPIELLAREFTKREEEINGVGNGIRTHDPQSHNLVL